jgi:peptidoglycan-N-acetylmuramic acid deacetylase
MKGRLVLITFLVLALLFGAFALGSYFGERQNPNVNDGSNSNSTPAATPTQTSSEQSSTSMQTSTNTATLTEPSSASTSSISADALTAMCPTTLDNTKYGWGMRILPNHQTPDVGAKAQQLVQKYHAIFTGNTDEKVVYLTFDEGYEAGNTATILDILKENDVKAAFFITGAFIRSDPDLVQRMVDEGHIVGNHTVNHVSLPTVSDAKAMDEINRLAQMYYELTHQTMKYLRPPNGEYSERSLCVTNALGYRTVFWSIAMADWVPLKGGPDEAYNTVMGRLHNGAVILLHAVSPDDVQVLDKLIKDIKAQGYSFETLDEIP